MGASGGYDSEEERTAAHLSSRGLSQPLEAVKNVPRSPNRSSSSRSGDSRDFVSERTPESSLVEQELLSPLVREWKSTDDKELGVMSGNERLLLRLGGASLEVTSPGVDTAVTSDPGDKVLLARLRFTEDGGGSSLGIICLHLPVREQRHWLLQSDKMLLLANMLRDVQCNRSNIHIFIALVLQIQILHNNVSLPSFFENKPRASFPLHQSHYSPLT